MELHLSMWSDSDDGVLSDDKCVVAAQPDIRTAGYAVSRAVRHWLERMPFAPQPRDLRFHVTAEVVNKHEHAPAKESKPAESKPKHKKRARK